jgi:hypothetical protein
MKFYFRSTKNITEYQNEFNRNLDANFLFKGLGIQRVGTLKDIYKKKANSYLYTCQMEYLYPNTVYIWLLIFVVGIIFQITWLWLTCICISFFMSIIQSKYFFFLVLKWGLTKKGFKGKIKLVRG